MTGEQRAEVAPALDAATTRVEALRIALHAVATTSARTLDGGELDRILDATLDAIQRVDTVPLGTVGVMFEVKAERQHQIEKGYTPEHDDEHGLVHIMDQVSARLLPARQLHTRDDLVEAAALLVAAVEWMDRVAPSAYPDDMEPSA